MIATSVYNYLEPYLPPQVVYSISMVFFVFEKFFMPKFYDVYSHASLDPKTLLPFVISAIALYLSIVSIYHAFKAAFRIIWFLIKWGIVIVIFWFILGLLNEAKGHSEGGHSPRHPFQSYQDSVTSWWNGASWSLASLDPQSFIGPLQMMLGSSAASLFEPMFNHFQSHSSGSNSFRPGSKHSSSSNPSFKPPKQQSSTRKSQTRQSSENPEQPNVYEFFQKFWTQTLRNPLQSILRETRRQNEGSKSQTSQSSRTSNR